MRQTITLEDILRCCVVGVEDREIECWDGVRRKRPFLDEGSINRVAQVLRIEGLIAEPASVRAFCVSRETLPAGERDSRRAASPAPPFRF